MNMLALTVWQPWASLIAIGAKPFEFRGWVPPRSARGQRMAIHAGARPVRPSEVFDLIVRLRSPEARLTGLRPEALPLLLLALEGLKGSPDTLFGTKAGLALPLSHVVCTAVIGEPVNGFAAVKSLGAVVNDSDRGQHANWGWPMLDVQRLEPPVPARGKQGLWEWAA